MVTDVPPWAYACCFVCQRPRAPRFVHELRVPRLWSGPEFRMILTAPRAWLCLRRGPPPFGLAWSLPPPPLPLLLRLLCAGSVIASRISHCRTIVLPRHGLASCVRRRPSPFPRCAARSPSSWKESQSKWPLWAPSRPPPCFLTFSFFLLFCFARLLAGTSVSPFLPTAFFLSASFVPGSPSVGCSTFSVGHLPCHPRAHQKPVRTRGPAVLPLVAPPQASLALLPHQRWSLSLPSPFLLPPFPFPPFPPRHPPTHRPRPARSATRRCPPP